jgi:hypothetical protein
MIQVLSDCTNIYKTELSPLFDVGNSLLAHYDEMILVFCVMILDVRSDLPKNPASRLTSLYIQHFVRNALVQTKCY